MRSDEYSIRATQYTNLVLQLVIFETPTLVYLNF